MAEKTNVPEIRFAGFTDPWEQRKLCELADRYKELVPTPCNGYVRMGVRSHAKGTFLTEVEPGQQIEEQELSKVKADNLVVNIVFAWEHAVAITSVDDAKALVSHRFPQFSFHDDMEPGFFRYAILDEAFRWHLWLASPSGAGRNKTLNVGTMLEYEFSVPKKAEQAKIAAFFDHLDDLITLHQRKYDKLAQLKKSMLDKMFPKPGERFPEIRFAGFTDPWEQRKLNEYLETSREKNESCRFDKDDVLSVSGDYGIVNQIEFQGRSYAGASVTNYGVVHKGDVVYTKSPLRSNPYGIIKTNRGNDGIVSTLYAVYHPAERTHPDFVEVYFEQNARMNNYMAPLVSKGAKNDMKVSAENALEGAVIFPEIEEQEVIASYFSQLDHLITLHQREPQFTDMGYMRVERALMTMSMSLFSSS